jgi:arylsulfatase
MAQKSKLPIWIVDTFPTIPELAGISYPDQYGTKTTQDLDGRSLLPAFKGHPLEGNPYYLSGTSEAFRMYRKGDWKLLKQNNDDWELYDLKTDPTELNNLAQIEQNKYQELITEYQRLKANNKSKLKLNRDLILSPV